MAIWNIILPKVIELITTLVNRGIFAKDEIAKAKKEIIRFIILLWLIQTGIITGIVIILFLFFKR